MSAFENTGRLNNTYTFKNKNLKNRKLKRKRKQKRKRGSLREGREAPPRRCPHPFRFCFRFRFNFRFFKFSFLYVYVLVFNRPVHQCILRQLGSADSALVSVMLWNFWIYDLLSGTRKPTGRLNTNTYTYKNKNLKNRKSKRKRKQKRNG